MAWEARLGLKQCAPDLFPDLLITFTWQGVLQCLYGLLSTYAAQRPGCVTPYQGFMVMKCADQGWYCPRIAAITKRYTHIA